MGQSLALPYQGRNHRFRGQGARALLLLPRSEPSSQDFREQAAGKSFHVINAFEPSHFEHVAAWSDSSVGNRPPAYSAYKERRVESITNRVCGYYPGYRSSLRLCASASVLTFRDYLCSPYGSAYGIKQKVGQINLFGKLPLRNIYAAGQSAVLPGLMGAMLSSFVIARTIVGRQAYGGFIESRL
ncbi:MAG: hypothetical protein MJA29_13780 [Candidatus Omnitrophica bacterium]|nr:hypothetical protein [Candidatus Omnitrophota bacterium]